MVSQQLSLPARIALRIKMVYWDQMSRRFIIVQTVYSFPLKCRLCLFLCLSLSSTSCLPSSITHILLFYFPALKWIYLDFYPLSKLSPCKLSDFMGAREWQWHVMQLIKVLGTLSPWLATQSNKKSIFRDRIWWLERRMYIWNNMLWKITNTLAIIIYNLETCKSKDNLLSGICFTWITRKITYFIAKFYVKHSTRQMSLYTICQLSRIYMRHLKTWWLK